MPKIECGSTTLMTEEYGDGKKIQMVGKKLLLKEKMECLNGFYRIMQGKDELGEQSPRSNVVNSVRSG
jgi:hypothetical protein